MHSEFQVIDLLFRLTIFLLLAYKTVSLSRKYLIPFLYGEIKEECNSHEDLIEKENILISSQHKIETQIRHQHILFESLEQNVQAWQNMLINQKIEQEIEFNRIKNIIEEKRKKQQKNYVLLHISREVLPESINMAKNSLINKYLGQGGNVLFDNVIEKMAIKDK